jgi:hypothetical protein
LSLREQFEIDIAELGDRVHQLGLEELEVREKEIKVFEESLEVARSQISSTIFCGDCSKKLDNFNN